MLSSKLVLMSLFNNELDKIFGTCSFYISMRIMTLPLSESYP